MTHNWFALAFQSTFRKEAKWANTSDTVKCLLTTNTYVPNQNTHQYKDVSITNEVTGTNYTAGGATISPCTDSEATLVYAIDGADAAWTTVTITGARYAIPYDDTPASNKPLLSYVNFGADQSPAGVNLTVQWDAAGVVKVTVS